MRIIIASTLNLVGLLVFIFRSLLFMNCHSSSKFCAYLSIYTTHYSCYTLHRSLPFLCFPSVLIFSALRLTYLFSPSALFFLHIRILVLLPRPHNARVTYSCRLILDLVRYWSHVWRHPLPNASLGLVTHNIWSETHWANLFCDHCDRQTYARAHTHNTRTHAQYTHSRNMFQISHSNLLAPLSAIYCDVLALPMIRIDTLWILLIDSSDWLVLSRLDIATRIGDWFQILELVWKHKHAIKSFLNVYWTLIVTLLCFV